MSRPLKTGIEYFMLDCSMDSKIKLIQARYGLPGFAIVIKLYQKIYGEYGYYCNWDEDETYIFMVDNGISNEDKELVDDVVSMCIEKDIFDKTLYERFGILTSNGIQKRFFIASARRKGLEIEENYVLCNASDIPDNVVIKHISTRVNVDNNPSSSGVNVDNNPSSPLVNDYKSTQMKRNEMKRDDIDSSLHSESLSDRVTDYDGIKELWNELDGCGDIKAIRSINGKRKDSVRARIKEYGVDGFREAIDNIKRSDFLQGKHGGNPWVIDFDWFVRPNNFPKVLEGKYNNSTNGGDVDCNTTNQKSERRWQ